MHLRTHKAELAACWVTFFFVIGEFSIALFDLVWDGKALALFMAVNTLMRETKGRKEYHLIFVRALLRVRSGLSNGLPSMPAVIDARKTLGADTPKPVQPPLTASLPEIASEVPKALPDHSEKPSSAPCGPLNC